MAVWFGIIGLLGIGGIIVHPGVLAALDPRYGIAYLSDMALPDLLSSARCSSAQPARKRSRPTWSILVHGRFAPSYGLVLPALVLNYAGQTAVVADGAAAPGINPFFKLCPSLLQLPLVGLATVATIIASQSIISGAFSMTRQAIQLGLCPRLHIV
jgi:KUP system potassium uptake protein